MIIHYNVYLFWILCFSSYSQDNILWCYNHWCWSKILIASHTCVQYSIFSKVSNSDCNFSVIEKECEYAWLKINNKQKSLNIRLYERNQEIENDNNQKRDICVLARILHSCEYFSIYVIAACRFNLHFSNITISHVVLLTMCSEVTLKWAVCIKLIIRSWRKILYLLQVKILK